MSHSRSRKILDLVEVEENNIPTPSSDVQILGDVYNKPENQSYLNVTEYFSPTEVRKRALVNYRVSPIDPGESDADLSDGDPTFEAKNGKEGKNLLFPSKRSSSSSSSTSSTSSSSSSSSSPSNSSEDETLEENLNANDIENITPEPTKDIDGEKRKNQDSVSQDITSTTLTDCTVVKGKKRTRQPENWKQTKAKILRNCGKSYRTLSIKVT